MGLNTAYVERKNLTSRQMNGRIVRKTLSFSKEEKMLKASCSLEDAVYNFTRPVKSCEEKLIVTGKDGSTDLLPWQLV